MAEMASMYPVSGGQYHWVALLAPKGHAKFLSWLTGWISMLGWQAAASTGTYLAGTTIQALLALNIPGYEAPRWQATLIMYAFLLLTIFVNTVLVQLLPGFEKLILVLHVIGFFAVFIPVVHFAPISTNAFVLTEFVNRSGYGSDGLSWFVGQSASAVLFIGYDGACHMAEEVANASSNVPKAMISTVCINGALGLATYIFILYCFGNPEETLGTPFGLPFIQIFQTALQSQAATTALTCLLISLYTFATFNFVASASRQAWAFARDNGLPYSRLFSRVSVRAVPSPVRTSC
jgi:choline transport protein